MSERMFRDIVVVAMVVLVAVVVTGAFAYSAGLAQGVGGAERQVVTVPQVPQAPQVPQVPIPSAPYYGPYPFHRPFGFGPLGCLIPLLFFFLLFGLLRRAAWHRHYRGGPAAAYGQAAQPAQPAQPEQGPSSAQTAFEEWHRRAHERDSQQR